MYLYIQKFINIFKNNQPTQITINSKEHTTLSQITYNAIEVLIVFQQLLQKICLVETKTKEKKCSVIVIEIIIVIDVTTMAGTMVVVAIITTVVVDVPTLL